MIRCHVLCQVSKVRNFHLQTDSWCLDLHALRMHALYCRSLYGKEMRVVSLVSCQQQARNRSPQLSSHEELNPAILPTITWAWKWILPQSSLEMITAQSTPRLQPVRDPEAKDPVKLCPGSWLRNCEIINVCCWKPWCVGVIFFLCHNK